MSFRNLLFTLLALATLGCLGSAPMLTNDLLADDTKPANKDGDQEQNEDPQQADNQPAEDEEQEESDEESEGFDLAQRWLERMRNVGRRNPNEKSHDSIKAAFAEISTPASDKTALIFAGDKPCAIGTVVAKDGYILTKASELDGDLSCRLKDGRHLNAELIGVHEEHDLAMLKIDADDLQPMEWDDEHVPTVGSWLVTAGIEDQALAIGVVSVEMRKIAQTPGVLGVSLDDGEGGALITEVMRRSAAKKAGMEKDDIVLSVNGKKTRNRESMVREIRKHKPGDEVKLKIKRDGEQIELTATLGSHFTSGPAARSNFQNALGGQLSLRRAGFEQAIQHDTVLEPHECGGPVLNLDGKAVGINIARAGRVNSYALPASLVVAVIEDLKSGDFAVEEPSPTVTRIAELEREIQQMTATVNEKAAQKADAQRRLKQSEEVLQAALDSQAAAKEAADQAAKAVKDAEGRLEELQAELEKLESE